MRALNWPEKIVKFILSPIEINLTDEYRLPQAILIVMAAGTSLGGLVWGTIYWLLGVPEVAIWPYGYVILSFLNLMIYLRTKHFRSLQVGQLVLILLIPSFLQWNMGGFGASGAVILWSFLSPIVALVVSRRRSRASYWLIPFLVLIIVSGLLEGSLIKQRVIMPDYAITIFYVMNMLAPLLISYFTVYYFIGQSRASQSAIREQSQLLSNSNQSLKTLTAHLEETSEELRFTVGRLTAVVNSLVDGLVVTDTNGKITDFNSTLTEMLGLEEHDIAGKSFTEIFSQDLINVIRKAKNPKYGAFEEEIILAAGRVGGAKSVLIPLNTQQLQVSKSDNESHHEQSIGTVTLIRDITREKEIDRMKTDFISTVSHELRTPLTSVLGFAKIIQKRFQAVIKPLLDDNDDVKVQKAVSQVSGNIDIIVSEGERLTALINDVLDIAKMEKGKQEWQMKAISLAAVTERAIAATSALFDEGRSVKLEHVIDSQVALILADEDRLMQAIINLISNASKFTVEGKVTCRVWQSTDKVYFSIADTGIGIPKDDLSRVFDKFTQIGNTLTDKPQGTGLGLPICKEIIERHEGRIWVESQLGKGTIFTFFIPIQQASTLTQLPALNQVLDDLLHDPQNQKDAKENYILIVDDEEYIRKYLREVLEAEGYQVHEAKDAMEALKEIKQSRPSLIILDVIMPNIDGFELARLLKDNPLTMEIPIIIISIVENKEHAYRLGVNYFLQKPVNEEILLSEIGKIRREGAKTYRILLMLEDKSLLQRTSESLQLKGHSVIEVQNRQELMTVAIETKPELIVVSSISELEEDILKNLRQIEGLEHVHFMLYI